jgi:hypothetical protein
MRYSCVLEWLPEGVKKSPPILGGDEARKGFGGGKGRV